MGDGSGIGAGDGAKLVRLGAADGHIGQYNIVFGLVVAVLSCIVRPIGRYNKVIGVAVVVAFLSCIVGQIAR